MDISVENKRIAEHWGYDAQSNQLVEECAELIQAVNKYRRFKGQNTTKEQMAIDNLVEEIADVEIMLEQIKHLLQIPEEELQAIKVYKINRTKERVAGGT